MFFQDETLLLVCGTLSSGGAERILSILSGRFADYFGQVKILMWRKAPVFYPLDRRIEQIVIPEASGTGSVLKQMCWFRHYVKTLHPYGVVSFLAPFNMLSIVSLYKSGIPLLIAERNDPRYDCPNRVWRKIRNFLYGFSRRLCVQTCSNKEYFPAYIRKKTDVIYNPVFLPSSLVGAALSAVKTKTIVSVGRFNPQKNFHLLLDAFSLVVKEFPDYKLIIYGDGELRGELEEHICHLHLETQVELPGVRKDLHCILVNAGLFVMSSDYEGMSNALIEAMCLGLPCISTRVSGATDLIQHGVNGGLVNTGNRDELSKMILYFLHHPLETREMAKKAVRIAEQLDTDYIVDEWIEFIRKGCQ